MKKILIFSLTMILLGASPAIAEQHAGSVDLAKIRDGTTWKLSNATGESLEMDGKPTVRVKADGDSGLTANAGLVLACGVRFSTGVIELDLKGRSQRPSFLGVVFNVTDPKTFEGVYFRPFNFKADEPFHHRAVQYIAWPKHTWDQLRKENPGRFENAVNPAPDPDGWFHARIEVAEKTVRVYLNGAKEPSLTVNRLAEGRGKLPIGLFVDVAEGLFANLSVKSAGEAER